METYKVIFKEGETTGVYGISLVNDPAMESLWVTLSKEEQLQLKSIDTEKRIVCGAVLIPNKPIYRNQNGAEFNIVFPAETIELASQAFLENMHQKSSTLEHNVDSKLNDVCIVQTWIKEDDVNDKSVMYGFNDPIGTWYASMKINNPEIWNDYVKTGKVKGFSIDGFFDMEKVKMSKNETTDGVKIWFENTMLKRGDLVTDLSGNNLPNGEHELMTNVIISVSDGIVTDIQEVNLKSEFNMSEQKRFIDEVKQIIKDGIASLALKKETEVKLGSVNTADGSVKMNFEGDTIAVGTALTMTAPDGSELPVPDGEYSLEDGNNVTVMGGIVQEVATATEEATDVEQEQPMNPQTAMSDSAPAVKSEKHTQEVFYQLSKEDLSNLIVELGNIVDAKVNALKVELTKQEEVVELTKTKPAKTKAWEEMTALERFRASKQN